MKKKAIEKIAYIEIELDDAEKNKDVKYIGATKLEKIANEEHLFLEIYKNEKTRFKIPVVRIVLTKQDFGNYYPETGEWSNKMIKPTGSCGGLLWETNTGYIRVSERIKSNSLYDEKDLERIRTFTNQKIWNEEEWWMYIQEQEDTIYYERRDKENKRRYERRTKALEERKQNTPVLPEKKILKEVNKRVFENKHFLFYKKKGAYANIACTACGGVTKARWKCAESFEQQFERQTEEPKEGEVGHCPICNAIGEYACQGRHKKPIRKNAHVYLAQKGKKKGVIVRYMEVEKEWSFESINANGEDILYNAIEKLYGIERIKASFLEKNKNPCVDFLKFDYVSGKEYWDDCNNYGLYKFAPEEGYVIKESFKNITGTMFQYSAIESYLQKVNKVNLIDYFRCYQRMPQLEMICKLGLYSIAEALVRCRYGIVVNEKAKNLQDFLGIYKERAKLLVKQDYKKNLDLIETMQQERTLKQRWTEEQLLDVTEINLSTGQLQQMLKFMSIQKLINRIKKYSGCDNFSTVCGYSKYRIQEKARLYLDYLNMREEQGYDMTDSIIIAPKNLEEAHNKMVFEIEKEELEKRIKEVNSHYLDIRSNYKKIAKKYSYKADEYMIRPARSAAEIVIEGRMLHHCVGRNEYLERHNKGKSFILFLRSTKTPNVPFVTVEINRDRILQWYGAYDKKPNQKEIQEWLDEYVLKHLKRQEFQKNIA